MKIWRFYKKPNDPNDINQRYDLYALTNHKEYAKNFMSVRDMDKFFMKCTKEDQKTYISIANDNRDCVICEKELITKDINKNGLINHKKIKILMTEFEYQIINGEEFQTEPLSDENWWKNMPDYRIFNKKIIEALRTIEFIFYYKMFNPRNTELNLEDDDYSAPNVWVDEFSAFISVFGDTFK